MTEDEARSWVSEKYDVSRETKLERFVGLLREFAATQNLIAPSTLEHVWSRHIVDSAQLLAYVEAGGSWIDIGSGAGLPGVVIAILRDDPVELVEPRKLRTAFLEHVVTMLDLRNVSVHTARIERVAGPTATAITARAVSSLDQLFRIASHRASGETVWILPKGRSAELEVEVARRAWHGSFHVELSITAPDSLIVIAKKVRAK